MFPFGAGHVITSEWKRWEGKAAVLSFTRQPPGACAVHALSIDGGGAKANFVCGYFGCDSSPFNPLLGALPRMLVVRRTRLGWG